MFSVILPCRNEKDITNMVQAIRLMYSTAEIIIIEDNEGKGKGWAIRQGIKSATKDRVVFLDADIDIHPGEIHTLLPHSIYYDVVIGIKDIKKLPPRRAIVSLGYRLLVKLLFRLNISDTQTGLKIWKRHKIPEFKINGFGFDLEMLVKARKANLRIKEVPINCRIYSAVKVSSIFKTLWETLRIWVSR